MKDFSNIIQFEHECTYLDFKAIEYQKHKFSDDKREPLQDFIKDVLSMANADYIGDRYIVIGVKIQKDGSKEFSGIESVSDSAGYQQLVRANIEPKLNISYEPFLFANKKLAVFTISNCSDQPYCIKKDFGFLKQGECFIRKGSMQMRCNRSDFERMIEIKVNKASFTEEIAIYFKDSHDTSLVIETNQTLEIPSEIAKIKMTKTLDYKRAHVGKPLTRDVMNMPYYHKSIEELEKDIESVKDEYLKADLHYIFEEKSYKLNLEIVNLGTEYLIDASIKIFVPIVDGLEIADKIYQKMNFDNVFSLGSFNGPNMELIYYPKVVKKETEYIIEASLGDVKHSLPAEIFDIPIRLVAMPSLVGKTVNINCKIFAKNLKTPINKDLKLLIR